jgi:outer membrane protein assembly factor BamB
MVDDWVVVPAGGPVNGKHVSLVAFHKDTGDEVWEGGNEQVGYSSPSLALINGQRQIVIVNESNVSGHVVDKTSQPHSNPGAVLWEFAWPGSSVANANVSQAHAVPDSRIFVSKAYGGGAALMQLTPRADGNYDVAEIWHNPKVLKTKFANVVIRGGYVFGLSDGILECVALDTGRRMWKSRRYGHGQILLAGDLLLVQAESGEVALVEPSPQRPTELGRFQAIEGKSWNNLCLYGPYLLVRNGQEAACYRLPISGDKSQVAQTNAALRQE